MISSIQILFSQFKWCLPMLLIGILLIIRRIGRRNGSDDNQLPFVFMTPFLYNYILRFIKYSFDSVHNLHPADYLMSFLSGLSCTFYKSKLVMFGWGKRNCVMCFEASSCESILKSSMALDKDWSYNFMECWLGTGLIISGKEKWKVRRKMLNPAFHVRILRNFLPVFNEQLTVLVNKLKKFSGQKMNICDGVVALCVLDIIGEAAVGVQFKAQASEDNEYIRASNNLTSTFIRWFLTPWYWIPQIFYLTPTGKSMRKDVAVLHNFVRKAILKRKATFLKEMEMIENFNDDDNVQMKKRVAFLDLLLYYHIKDKTLSMEDIYEEIDTILVAGSDSITMGISWTLYLLGLYKEMQKKVYQETRRIFRDDKERPVTINDLKEMKYLECFMKETLRLYPPIPLTLRRTTENITSGNYTIPADSSIIIFIYGLHRDPAVFANPECFDPDRFLPENCLGRHQFAFIPFLAGQRNCIGQRFAMMEIKAVVSSIVRNFEIHSFDQRDKIIHPADVLLTSKFGLQMKLEKR